MRPDSARPRKHIDRTTAGDAVVCLIAPHPGRVTFFTGGADHQRVTIERNSSSKGITSLGIGGLEIGLLRPDPTRPRKHIGGTAAAGAVVRLIATHPGRVAVFTAGTDHQRVAAERNSEVSEGITRIGIRGLEIRLLHEGSRQAPTRRTSPAARGCTDSGVVIATVSHPHRRCDDE